MVRTGSTRYDSKIKKYINKASQDGDDDDEALDGNAVPPTKRYEST